MDASSNKHWIKAVILFGIMYGVVGITFGELAGHSTSNQTRDLWRWAAWLVSAAAFALHIGDEHFRRRNSPRVTASHASAATALGAFALAVAANIHALWTATGNQRLLALALVIWPIMTGIPAFLVALAAAAVLARWRPRA